jgi:hypothetical protein
MLDRLTAADFEPLIGSAFAVDRAGGGAAAELVSVTPGRAGPGGRVGFSLVFRAATPAAWGQGTYPLTHPRLGRLDLFLVPVGREAGGLLLEAVFN